MGYRCMLGRDVKRRVNFLDTLSVELDRSLVFCVCILDVCVLFMMLCTIPNSFGGCPPKRT